MTAIAISIPAADILGRVLEDVGQIELPDSIGPGARLVRHGSELVLDYTNLTAIGEYSQRGQGEPPAEARITGTLTYKEPGLAQQAEPIVMRAEQGCRHYMRVPGEDDWGVLPRDAWSDFADLVLDGMTLEGLAGLGLDVESLGGVTSESPPLDEDPDQGASPWVNAYGCPMVLAMALTGTMTSKQRVAAHEEARRRASRASFWTVNTGVEGGVRLLEGRRDPWIMFRGYRESSNRGGWKDPDSDGDALYESPIPPGVPSKTGFTPGHPTHGDLELAIGLAVICGSTHLASAAWSTWQAWVRLFVARDYMSSRAIGRMLRTGALLTGITDRFPHLQPMLAADIDMVLDYQASRQRAGMISPDWDAVSSYHINLGQIDACLAKLGWTQAQIDLVSTSARKRWGDSDALWCVTQTHHGARSCRRVASKIWPVLDVADRQGRLRDLELTCEAFAYKAGREPAMDLDDAEIRLAAGVTGLYEDLALDAPVRFARGGEGHGDAVGVLGRFAAPALYQMAEDRPDEEKAGLLRAMAEPTLKACDDAENWGSRGDDRLMAVLESQWPVWRVRGAPSA